MTLQSNDFSSTQLQPQSTAATQATIPWIIQLETAEPIITLVVFVFGIGIGAAWAALKNSVKNMDKAVTAEIKPMLTDLRERFAVVEDRVESLWRDRVAPSHSQRTLNRRGLEILAKSGIREIIEQNKEQLQKALHEMNPQTSYDIEQASISVAMHLPEICPDAVVRLKDAAFSVGAEIDVVLFVGALYFRDQMSSQPCT